MRGALLPPPTRLRGVVLPHKNSKQLLQQATTGRPEIKPSLKLNPKEINAFIIIIIIMQSRPYE
jgi:hypothetical protein